MLIPIWSRQLLIGLVIQRSANAEDYVASKVRTLLEELQEITDNIAVRNGTTAIFNLPFYVSSRAKLAHSIKAI
jgi:hypothetical protein